MSSPRLHSTPPASPEKPRKLALLAPLFAPLKLLMVIALLIGVIAVLVIFLRPGGKGLAPGTPPAQTSEEDAMPVAEFRDRAIFLSGRESSLDAAESWLERRETTAEGVHIIVWDSALARDVDQFETLARERGIDIRRTDQRR